MADWLANYEMDHGKSAMIPRTTEGWERSIGKGVARHMDEDIGRWYEVHTEGWSQVRV